MPGFGILALRGYGALRRGATGGSLRWALAAQKRVSCAANLFPYPPLAPSPFRAMPCNVPVFWDDHCEYRDIFKKALT